MTSKTYTIKQAAELTGLRYETIRKAICAGVISPKWEKVINNKHYELSVSDIETLKPGCVIPEVVK